MDDSIGFSVEDTLSPKETTDCPEESGWTIYFDDLLSNNREHSSGCSSDLKMSFVSDAASCADLKFSDNNHVDRLRKLSFKKRRTRELPFDDALEDTASSPVNSPKVSHLRQYMNPRNKDGRNDSSDQKESSSEWQAYERNGLDFNVVKENEYTELKKKGLCLVPLSMLVNYHLG